MGRFLLNAASSCFVGLLCLTLPSALQVESTAVYERLDAVVNSIGPQVNSPLEYAVKIQIVMDNKHDLDAKVVTAMKDFIQLSALSQDLKKTCSIDTIPFLGKIEKSLELKGHSCRVPRKDCERVRNKIGDFVDSLIVEHGQKCQPVFSKLYNRMKKTGSKDVYNFAEKMGQELTAQLLKLTMYTTSKSITGSSTLRQQVRDADIELLLMSKLFKDCELELSRTKHGESRYQSFTECLMTNADVVLYTSTKLSKFIARLAIYGILDGMMRDANDEDREYLKPRRVGSSFFSSNIGLDAEKFNAIFEKYLQTPCDEVVDFFGGAMFNLLNLEKEHGDMLKFYQLGPKQSAFINAWLGFNACKMVQEHSQVARNLLQCGTSKMIDPSKTFREISQSSYLGFI